MLTANQTGQVEDVIAEPLRVRWLGRVDYSEAWDLQQRLHQGTQDHLLLVEHNPVFTLGRSGDTENFLADADDLGVSLVRVNRGGDITFHGPGQLVGYPILTVPGKRGGGLADTAAYVHSVEQLVIDVVGSLGLSVGRISGLTGVWVEPQSENARKIAAIGVRLAKNRSMHGFALNNSVDLDWFDHIVPCGIADKRVTSLAAEGIEVSNEELVKLFTKFAPRLANRSAGRDVDASHVVFRTSETDLSPFSRGLGPGTPATPTSDPNKTETNKTESAEPERKGVPVRLGRRLDQAGVGQGLALTERKPEWMRVKVRTDERYLKLKATARELKLTTVCEEAGCPNIFDCWNEGTATFMLLGERCTRACGFCLVDTRKPVAVDRQEPGRVAKAIAELGIDFAVLTMVARDDLDDGGASIVAETVAAIREMSPGVGVEVLISDLQGSAESLATVCDANPDIVNHNVETVPRLQRAVRPSASYARSLALLARAADAGQTTKSGLIVGMGETFDEVAGTLADLAGIGCQIVTVGQYLRPTSHHLPIDRWWTPDEFAELRSVGEKLGITHVEANPLTRSSHHAGSVARAAAPAPN